MQLTPNSPKSINNSVTTNLNDNSLPENIICFSHLRWDFVFQRPQHLLTRLSNTFNVYFIEEPVFDATDQEYYTFTKRDKNLWVMVPHLVGGLSHEENVATLKFMFGRYMDNKQLSNYIFWYYTPMALNFSNGYDPALIIYDCMDELSAFKFAPAELKAYEKELMEKAGLVFTGGQSLYEAKKHQHSNIHAFPSSIDRKHFLKARTYKECPADQINTDKLKLGFYGVLDERFDINLIKEVADARPDWQIILIGPVVKIDPASLPKNDNIHYLGPKNYQELPEYMATWDMALIPFMLNESTRFISPTKTPEYLAAGLPVVSTPIRDVVSPYGNKNLVHIAATGEEFVAAIEKELQATAKENWRKRVDTFLSTNSWDITCNNMLNLMKKAAYKNLYMPIAQ